MSNVRSQRYQGSPAAGKAPAATGNPFGQHRSGTKRRSVKRRSRRAKK